MKVPVQKRYCYKQNKWGGIGEALEAVARLQDKHPDEAIALEYNERSTSVKYRVVRITEDLIEVNDPPADEHPACPKAAILPDHEVEVTWREEKVDDPWYKRSHWRKWVRATHKPTGIFIEEPNYGYSSPETRVRELLNERIDPTYAERLQTYRDECARVERLRRAWREEVAEAVKGAGTFAK